MIFRRELLERDSPVDFRERLTRIRDLTGWGIATIAFILNEPRTTVREWALGRDPGFENGRAILKLCERVAHEREQVEQAGGRTSVVETVSDS